MKRSIYILIFTFLGFSLSAFSQDRSHGKEQIKALKIYHITEQLELTEKEAEKFWPIYNYYDKKLHDLRMTEKFNLKKQIEALGGVENINNKDAKTITEKILEIDKEIFEAKKKLFF